MVGIVSYGAYIPIYRLSREAIGAMWVQPMGKGEKAVANADEDSLTMGVEAVIDCLTGMDRKQVDGLYFASASAVYAEKQTASIIRAAADLREDIFSADFANSLRGATSAFTAAADAVKAGSAKKVIVVASDCRIPPPNTTVEATLGDGAAALMIGDTDVVASIEGSHHTSSEFIDVYRKQEAKYMATWEERFVRDEGFVKILPQAVHETLKKYKLTPKNITKAVFNGPDARTHATMGKAMGFDAKTQIQDHLCDSVGQTGTAMAPMLLVAALEDAKPGDTILFANYADGADVFLLRVTEHINKVRNRRGVKRHLASKLMLPSYGKYVEIRDLMEWEPAARPQRRTSLQVIWRERQWLYPLYGQQCKSCGNIQFPRQRLCMYCRAQDNFDMVRLSDRRGKLFTFSMDERAVEIVLPKVFSVVDLHGGGRFYSVMTDRDTEKIHVGMELELTFRRQLEGGGLHNYFWRTRPIRC